MCFLSSGSLIFEIYPNRYWKAGYGPLAESYGHRYSYVMSESTTWIRKLFFGLMRIETCFGYYLCRMLARHDDVRLDDAGLEKLKKNLKF